MPPWSITLVAVCPLSTEWNGVGSGDAFHQTGGKDFSENVCTGDIVQKNARNCCFHGAHLIVAVLDVKNLVVIDPQDSLSRKSR